jgi:tetratricopeptide (TPR) repeat protein
LGNDPDFDEALKSLEACAAIDPAYKADLLESAKTIQSRHESNGTVTPIPAPKAGVSYLEAKTLGDKAQAQGQYDLALQYFKKAEAGATTPKAKGAAANRQGLVLLEARRPKEAVAHFERAIKAEPSEKIFLNNLGLAYWTLYDAGLSDTTTLKQAVDAFYKSNGMDASYHGENLRMALNELKEADPALAKPYDSKKDPETGEAAPMGSPTAK